MKLLRSLSTPRLLAVVTAVATVAVAAAAIAVAAGGGGPTPPAKPLAQAIHDALGAPEPAGITARIKFTNRLFPSGALLGDRASALMTGASGRLWITNDGRGRLELQSAAGDAQIVWSRMKLTVYDASSNTAYTARLPAMESRSPSREQESTPTVSEISDFLSRIAEHASVSGALPTDVAGRPAYSVSVSPKHDDGLLGSARLAWDSGRGVPLRVGIYAQGHSSPVLELTVTEISYGPVSAGDVDIAPPARAKTVDLGSVGKEHPHRKNTEVSGLHAAETAAGFSVVAPNTLVGLPRRDVRLVGRSDSRAVLVVYGRGLGALVLVERKAGDRTPTGSVLSSLPTVSLDGLTAHELATQLGTAIEWQRGGVAYVLAGSLPPAAAETAARRLK